MKARMNLLAVIISSVFSVIAFNNGDLFFSFTFLIGIFINVYFVISSNNDVNCINSDVEEKE